VAILVPDLAWNGASKNARSEGLHQKFADILPEFRYSRVSQSSRVGTVLPLREFVPTIQASIPRFRSRPGGPAAPDAHQEACICHPATIPLQIVAGPGSGKTTVLVLRALRLITVDGFPPEQVLITTFTRKAADEIRTRLIEWGILLLNYLRSHGPVNLQPHLAHVDINRFMTGTLDSVCEDALRTMRAAIDAAPVLLESFAANALMHRRGLTGTAYNGGTIDPSVATYLASFKFDREPPENVGELIGSVRPLFDRFSHDMVDLKQYRTLSTHSAARDKLVCSFDAYVQHLKTTNRLDFSLLEYMFLERLRAGRLARLTEGVRALLVDEYQDTNLLQESIYFELFKKTGASLTVVGDDLVCLYGFPGATVVLFRGFPALLTKYVPGVAVHRIDLVGNYRSTPEIVSFCNDFITNDRDFLPARVHPPKPAIQAQLASNGVPVLGMFRSDLATLSSDLATFLSDVFVGNGRALGGTTAPITIKKAPSGGNWGDAVLLAHSVNEYTEGFKNQPPRPRLPHHLRQALLSRNVEVFNPRGQALRDIQDVQRLVGAMLECLDAGSAIQGTMRLRGKTHQYLATFRDAYDQYARSNPHPISPHGLTAFVNAWGRRQSQSGTQWPNEWPALELCFTLLAWFPRLRDDPEGQVHLEAVTRAIAQSATFSPYRALILHGAAVGRHARSSVESIIRDVFAPIAESSIDVDEDIMPSVPRDRFPMMTIHQAKGLEFPLVIVDVSSDFRTDHPKNRFRRFPVQPSSVVELEDDLAPACNIGSLRQGRTALQRTFEDLIRLYYVAYSRPQSLLLLVGLDKCLQYSTSVRNVATFWRSDGTWAWVGPYTSKRPPGMANAIPLELI